MMQRFSVWLLDELGEEFNLKVNAKDWDTVREFLGEQYPECSIEVWKADPVPTTSNWPAHHTLKGGVKT